MPSGQYGAAIAEQGIPVTSATDDQKVIDTRWFTLDIVGEPEYSTSITRSTLAPGDGSTFAGDNFFIPIFQHNLGYLPAFDYEVITYSISDPSGTPGFFLYADTENIYFVGNNSTLLVAYSINIQVQLRVYAVPVTASYTAPSIQTTPKVNNQELQYGAEFLGSNGGNLAFGNAQPQQLAFRTSLRPITILATGTYTIPPPPATSIIIPYPTPYPPLFQVARYLPAGYSQTANSQQNGLSLPGPLVGGLTFAGSRSSIANNTIIISGQQSALSGSFAYVLFKDPLNVSAS